MHRVFSALVTCWLLTASVAAQTEYQDQWGYILQFPSIWNRCNIVKESGDLVDCEQTAPEIRNGSWTMAFHENRAFITNFERNETSTCDISPDDHLLRSCKSSMFYKSDFRPSDIQIVNDKAYILNGKELDEAFISMCEIRSGNLEECRDVWSGSQYPYMINMFGDKVHLTFDNSDPNATESIEVCPVDTSTGLISDTCIKTGPLGSQMLAMQGDSAYVLTAAFRETTSSSDAFKNSSSYGFEYQHPVFELQKCKYSSTDGSITNCEKTLQEFRSPFSMESNGKYLYVTAYENISRCEVAPKTQDILSCTTNSNSLGQTEFYDLVFNPATIAQETIPSDLGSGLEQGTTTESAQDSSPSPKPSSDALSLLTSSSLFLLAYHIIYSVSIN